MSWRTDDLSTFHLRSLKKQPIAVWGASFRVHWLVISDNGKRWAQMQASSRQSCQIFFTQEGSHEIGFLRPLSVRHASVVNSGPGTRIQDYAGTEQDRLLREGIGGTGRCIREMGRNAKISVHGCFDWRDGY